MKVPPYSKDGETAPIQVELDDELQKDESLRNLHKKSLIHLALQDPITRGLLAKVSGGGGSGSGGGKRSLVYKKLREDFSSNYFSVVYA